MTDSLVPDRDVSVPSMNIHAGLGFAREEYERRYLKVTGAMQSRGIDLLLVRGPENICYLTGYDTAGYYGYHCLIIAPGQEPIMLLRRLEHSNVDHTSWLTRAVPCEDHQDPVEVTAATLRNLGIQGRSLGIEKSSCSLTVSEYEKLSVLLPDSRLVDGSGVVEAARLVKSEAEVEMIRRAVHIAEAATSAGLQAVQVGVTEDEIAGEVHRTWCREGAEYSGAPNYIVAGPRGARAHVTWQGGRVKASEPVFLEIGASKHRYAGAVMRCAVVGSPTSLVQEIYDASVAALEAVIAAIRTGAVSQEVDSIGRSIIADAGFSQYHHHRLGYSMGVNYPPDWGEGQIFSIRQGEARRLERNMTFHLVPACLVTGVGAIGCSAVVQVLDDGCEVLNTLPTDLVKV